MDNGFQEAVKVKGIIDTQRSEVKCNLLHYSEGL